MFSTYIVNRNFVHVVAKFPYERARISCALVFKTNKQKTTTKNYLLQKIDTNKKKEKLNLKQKI